MATEGMDYVGWTKPAEPVVDTDLRDRIMAALTAHNWAGGDHSNHDLGDFADVAASAVAPELAELEELRADKQARQGHECEAGCKRPHPPSDGSPFGTDTEVGGAS